MSPHYQEKITAPLTMHSGINTGLVVTADVDPKKGTLGVASHAVNVASSLSGLANPGEILVGHDTHVRAEGILHSKTLDSRKSKERLRLSEFQGVGCKGSRAGSPFLPGGGYDLPDR